MIVYLKVYSIKTLPITKCIKNPPYIKPLLNEKHLLYKSSKVQKSYKVKYKLKYIEFKTEVNRQHERTKIFESSSLRKFYIIVKFKLNLQSLTTLVEKNQNFLCHLDTTELVVQRF